MYEVVRKESSYGPRLVLCLCESRSEALKEANRARAQLRDKGYKIPVVTRKLGRWTTNPPSRASRARYTRTILARKKDFDPRSFRYIKVGEKRILIGCPKGKWSPSRRKCKVGTRGVVKLTPKRANIVPIAKPGYAFASSKRYPVSPDIVIIGNRDIANSVYVGMAVIDSYPHHAWKIRGKNKYFFQIARE